MIEVLDDDDDDGDQAAAMEEDCPVCLMPVGKVFLQKLPCGHRVCFDCLRSHAANHVANANPGVIKCPSAVDCPSAAAIKAAAAGAAAGSSSSSGSAGAAAAGRSASAAAPPPCKCRCCVGLPDVILRPLLEHKDWDKYQSRLLEGVLAIDSATYRCQSECLRRRRGTL